MLDSTMTLLHRIGDAGANLVISVLSQFFCDRPRIGSQTIGGDLFGCILVKTDGLSKEGFGASHIPRFTQANVYQIVIRINAPVEIAPHSFYSDIGFVHQPHLTDVALALCPYLFDKMKEEAFFPKPHCFVSKLKASQQEELGDISITELVAHSAKQHLEDDVGGDFDEVERRISALVEGATTALTPKHIVAQVGFTLE